jgi:hypothetical protein
LLISRFNIDGICVVACSGIPSNSFFSTILEDETTAGGGRELEEEGKTLPAPSSYPPVFSNDPFTPFDGEDPAPPSLPPPLLISNPLPASQLWSPLPPERTNNRSPQSPACPTPPPPFAAGPSDLLSLFPSSSSAGTVGNKKPTQKKPPKKTKKATHKNPLKKWVFWIFLNF